MVESLASGVLAVVTEIAKAASAAGYEVGVLYGCRPETPPDVRELFPADVFVFDRIWADRSPRAQFDATRAIRRTVRRCDVAIVHAHSSFAGLATACAGLAVKTVYTPHAYGFLRETASRAVRLANVVSEYFVARRSDLVVGCSQAEADVARERLRAPRVAAVPNGIPELDDAVPVARRRSTGRPKVVTAGRIGPQRRPESTARLLSMAACFADTEWIGDAPPGEPSAETVRRSGVPVSGWLTRDVATRRLAQADIYLHWTAWDGLPIIVLEAIAAGCVVIASDIPPNREILGSSFVFDSEADAARMITSLCADGGCLDAAAEAQLRRAQDFRASRMRSDWMAVYSRLLQQTPHLPRAGTS